MNKFKDRLILWKISTYVGKQRNILCKEYGTGFRAEEIYWIRSNTGFHPQLLLRNMRAVLCLPSGVIDFRWDTCVLAPTVQVGVIDPPSFSSAYHGNFTKLSSFYLSMPLRLTFIYRLQWPITNSQFISCMAIDFNFVSWGQWIV